MINYSKRFLSKVDREAVVIQKCCLFNIMKSIFYRTSNENRTSHTPNISCTCKVKIWYIRLFHSMKGVSFTQWKVFHFHAMSTKFWIYLFILVKKNISIMGIYVNSKVRNYTVSSFSNDDRLNIFQWMWKLEIHSFIIKFFFCG